MPYVPTGEQTAILGHDYHRHARVLAGPGTGKSATLVALVDHLLEGNPAPRIKLLTFTRAATAELAKKVSEHPAAAAERPSTIHSFSISVLLRNPGTGDFPEPLRIADKWEDKKIVLPTLARRAWVRVKKLDRLIREMAANWESLQPAVDPRVDPIDRARFLAAWGEHRQVYGYTLLAELPYALRHALHDHPDLDGVSYDLLIVDEYQDLNACDLEVLHLIAERGCAIIGAGDDDQSIYSFRRAAPEGIRRFPNDYPGCANYPLSITQRCGARIIEWASYVIDGDLGRPAGRPRLAAADGSPPGDVALLAFDRETSEAQGVAALIQNLNQRGVLPEEILVLMRSDHNGAFSRPIKEAMDALGIHYSDPEAVEQMLAVAPNRRTLATLRLLVNRRDSLAWATLFLLAPGIGPTFCDYIYGRANEGRVQFGEELFNAFDANFPGAPRSATRVAALTRAVVSWLDAHPLPDQTPEEGWGHWIVAVAGGDIVPAPTADCATLLHALDDLMEEQAFGRYLSQITPLGKDRALAESQGVRIMTMGGAKGLTVRATVVVGLEEGVVPRPDQDLSEERRLLYVAMTRAKEFLYCTWARRRFGPTARAGEPRVQDRRNYTSFLRGGPVDSRDGEEYLRLRGRA
ncbi:MAG TPA: ATP-dependent helicase [Terriglobales bacterium]|nr:ATP-dependent helicase [Terriglobales bacterium]